MTQPPANWYPDPQQPDQWRYWDGTQWTQHVAAAAAAPVATAPSPVPAQRKPLGVGAVFAIVAGSIVVVLVIIGVLAAIAIPVFLNQRQKAADIDARHTLNDIANQITATTVNTPGQLPTIEQLGSAVVVQGADGSVATVALDPEVTFGGLTGRDSDNWCVWVTSSQTTTEAFQYSTWNGIEPGSCSP